MIILSVKSDNKSVGPSVDQSVSQSVSRYESWVVVLSGKLGGPA
jgi:hypothetical protein